MDFNFLKFSLLRPEQTNLYVTGKKNTSGALQPVIKEMEPSRDALSRRLIFGVMMICGLSGLISCDKRTGHRNQHTDELSTTDDSRMFFKNVRQIFYDRSVHGPTRREMYRFKDRSFRSEAPILNLCIINDWQNERAYLVLEPNELMGSDTIRVWWEHPSGQQGVYTYTAGNALQQSRFADTLYQALKSELRLSVRQDGQSFPFLADEGSREAFRVTVTDFRQLTGRHK